MGGGKVDRAARQCRPRAKPQYNSRDFRPDLADGRWRDQLQLDPCDLAILDTHRIELKWGVGGYVKVLAVRRGEKNGERKYTALARLIIRAPEDFEVDHINGNTLDNRRCNLRLCTRAQNSANRRLPKSISGYRGVQALQGGREWGAKIAHDNVAHDLGRFSTAATAAAAYDRAARALHGDFAVLNFPSSVREES